MREVSTRTKLGAAEGEPGVIRVESSSSNGVQVLLGVCCLLRRSMPLGLAWGLSLAVYCYA